MMKNVLWASVLALACCAAVSELDASLRSVSDVKKWEADVKPDQQRSSTKLEETMKNAFTAIAASSPGKMACLACQAGIRVLRTLAKTDLTRSLFLSTAQLVCSTAAHQESDVCKGLSDSTGNAIFDVLQKLRLGESQIPPLACHAIANVCPMPEIKLKQLPLPSRKNAQPQRPKSRAVRRVLHLTDIHFDTSYQVGAEADCNKPICCQKDSASAIKSPAREWGEYKCDANQKMLASLLKNAANRHNYEMLLFTGDIPAHDIWKETPDRNAKTAEHVYEMLQTNFPKTPIYPAIGNHEAAPLNQFPLEGNSTLYAFMAKQWAKWIPSDQLASVRKGGFYAVPHSQDLTVLVLNTNIYYKNNYLVFLDPQNPDPHGMLQWLIKQLQAAEDRGTHVLLTGHIAPGSTDFYQHWSDAFHRIILRYSDTIAGQFYGHLHYDEFEIFYSNDNKSQEAAVNAAFLAPSMGTHGGINPSYRVYEIDGNNKVVNYKQFYANLRNQKQWTRDAEWELLYSAVDAYSTSPVLQPLTPAFLHQATAAMATNRTMFDKYWNYHKANGEIDACDAKCQERQICTLRAGRSKDNCAIIIPFS
ncbi:hypothetical protein DSO57_1011801 [Entomophthora muscae]|uniref:Uncharacterized protein n=1 Tax=Entomophthora muscae TaxID=34485 RepID=A0ACC2UGY3_9FUNG|nr:hypothetical protein DSO57_1011801 [Entomophthora muscae]